MKYLVLGRGEGARNLANSLGCKTMLPPSNKRARRKLFKEHDVVVNMGWSTNWTHVNRLGHGNEWKKDKAKASHIMREAGVKAIEYMSSRLASAVPRSEYPILSRKVKHSKGRDIRVIDEPEIVRSENIQGDKLFYVKIFKKEREYRAHVVFGEVVKLFRKHPQDRGALVWCNDTSKFERVKLNNSHYNSIKEQALMAVNALRLDIGAVDIGVRKFKRRDEEVIVFEVNTAPNLNEETAEKYAEEIRRHYE